LKINSKKQKYAILKAFFLFFLLKISEKV